MALLEQKNKRKTISQKQTTTAKQTVIVNIGEAKKKRKPRKKAAKKATRPTLALSSHPYAGAIFQTPNVPDPNIGRLYGDLKETIQAINMVRDRVQAQPLSTPDPVGLARVNSLIYKMPSDLTNTGAVESWLQGAETAPPESIAPAEVQVETKATSITSTSPSQKPITKIQNLIKRIDKALKPPSKKATSSESAMPYYSESAGSVPLSSNQSEKFKAQKEESKALQARGIPAFMPSDISGSEWEQFQETRKKETMKYRVGKKAMERSTLPAQPPIAEPYTKAKRTIKKVATLADIPSTQEAIASTSQRIFEQ